MSDAIVTLTSARAVVMVDLVAGGRLASLTVDGDELLYSGDPGTGHMGWGCYPMAPFAGRVRYGALGFGGLTHELRLNMSPHSIHGTVFDQHWERESENRFICDLGSEWPWEGHAAQTIEIDEEGLHLQLELHTAGSPFPGSIGWHPWFRSQLQTGERLRIDASVGRQLVRDDTGMPTGQWVEPRPRPWDDCFTDVTWPIVLDWAGRRTLKIDSSCEFVVIYDEEPQAWCVEPQSAPPDAVNSSADVVTLESPLIATTTWRW